MTAQNIETTRSGPRKEPQQEPVLDEALGPRSGQVVSREEALAALQRFAPSLRYTLGEQFFPIDVERYVSQCSLWVKTPDEPPRLLVPQGEMSLETLAQDRPVGFDSVLYLKFIEPLDILELAKFSINKAVSSLKGKHDQKVFRAGKGRLSRVGFVSRFVDALFSLTLLWRGRVPGDAAAAAALAYQKMQSDNEHFSYYGRLLQQNGWIVLQYWYLYPYNNWRSGFFGVNDHESDWEMVCLYCSDSGDEAGDKSLSQRLQPCWVAYASHDFSGDDLRRRWDDPEVQKEGEHAVVYAGAGSHASYFEPGEYLAEIELPFLKRLVQGVDKLKEWWVSVLQQAGDGGRKSEFDVFRIPFVDYARGDGASIGAGGEHPWEAHLIDEQAHWAYQYRGLWGLFAQDPIAGENAPAGPVYNRDGSVRHSWYDPLGWAGMDKVPPLSKSAEILERHKEDLLAQTGDLERSIAEKSLELDQLGVEADALADQPHLEMAYRENARRIRALSAELSELRRQATVNAARIESFDLYAQKLQAGGDPRPLRAHITRANRPSQTEDLRLGFLAELISATSIGLLMVTVVLLILLARKYTLFGLAALTGVMIFLEAGFRRKLHHLVNSLTIGLAIVSALVLLFEFFWQIVVAGILVAGLFIMWENVKELAR
jgi:hypothetical protein